MMAGISATPPLLCGAILAKMPGSFTKLLEMKSAIFQADMGGIT